MNKKTIKRILIMLVLFLSLGFVYQFNKSYTALSTEVQTETEIIHGTNITIKTENNKHAQEGIIMYPGGKVDPAAYISLLEPLAIEGYKVIIAKMPFNLAVFDIKRADKIIEDHPDITTWHMMGHSLGGAMAASYVAENHDINSLVLMAAYSTKDLTDYQGKVISLVGSEDKVINLESYEKYHKNLPQSVIEHEIEGGNHAQFGNYGNQKGDGEATISAYQQKEAVINYILKALSAIKQ